MEGAPKQKTPEEIAGERAENDALIATAKERVAPLYAKLDQRIGQRSVLAVAIDEIVDRAGRKIQAVELPPPDAPKNQ